MRASRAAIILLLILAAVIPVTLGGCGAKKQTDSFFAMGSYITQTVYNAENTLLESVKSDITQADANISIRIDNSYISLLNKEKTAVFDTQTYNILYSVVEFCGVTNGIFDISLLSLTDLWDIEGESPSVPNQDYIITALQSTGYENIIFGDNNTVTLNGGVWLDLGSVGKGYACDLAVEAYKEVGVSGIIAVGGSIGVNGKKPDGDNFLVGIRDPFSAAVSDIFAGIKLASGFVSTSGSYEKYFVEENKVYHHIFNSKTGYPVENELVSVSVVCDNGMLSDMLSTACFALGIDDSLSLLKQYGAEAVFVTNDKKVVITQGLRFITTVYADFEVIYI
ncbi:MAG: FAD:protein FMN transferase [Firmicutes bacterium HGW-Firmicutes-21]|nr:MAG: FAD:protein FMN transferase [Firmicutes bacterium HGW-Firmicutes-21]